MVTRVFSIFNGLFVTVLLSLPHIAAAQDNIATLRLTQSCSNCDFNQQNFPFATFAGYEFNCVDFASSNLEEANFSGVDFIGWFNDANLRGAIFTDALIGRSGTQNCPVEFRQRRDNNLGVFNNADLRGAKFDRVDFPFTIYFTAALIDGAIFSDSIVRSGIYLNEVSARGANFSNFGGSVSADDANFMRSNFANSRITWNANGTDFSSTIFDGSVMSRSNLTNSNFLGASFIGANLAESDLSGSDFTDADLTGAILTGVQFDGATLCNTTAPDGAILFTGC
jgi:uncharacterized protein YjbI with pentapeptide repeats